MQNLGKNEKLHMSSDPEEKHTLQNNKQINNSFTNPNISDENSNFFKMRASEHIPMKRPQIGALLNQNSINKTISEENQFISNTSSVPPDNKEQNSFAD